MWVAHGSQISDQPTSALRTVRATASKNAHKIRFVGGSARASKRFPNPQSQNKGATGPTSHPSTAAAQTATTDDLTSSISSSIRASFPTIEDVTESELSATSQEDFPPTMETDISAAGQDMASGSDMSIEEDNIAPDLPPLEFGFAFTPPVLSSPLLSGVSPTEFFQATTSNEGEDLCPDRTIMEGIYADARYAAFGLEQQSGTAPPEIFPRMSSPLRLPVLPPEPELAEPNEKNYDLLLKICKLRDVVFQAMHESISRPSWSFTNQMWWCR